MGDYKVIWSWEAIYDVADIADYIEMCFGLDPSIIFYFVDDAKRSVYIIRVLRHERNWQKILREGISYTFDQ